MGEIEIRKSVLALAAAMFLLALPGCANSVAIPGYSPNEGPFTDKNEQDYANAIPVEIDADILQACYEYSNSLGYEIEDKEEYQSVLLGESEIAYVLLDDDSRSDMLDEDDYLIIFKEIKAVTDADTGVILGRIPYV
jgi:hypothetical protein